MSGRKFNWQGTYQRRRWICVLAFIVLLLGAAQRATPQDATKPLRVLFIGNSLTYANELPAMVEAIAAASGQRQLVFSSVVFGGFSLEDHWQQGDARHAIAQGGWDVVMLQQGPSASSEGRKSLLEWTRRFAQEIRRGGARPALYMVWPAADRMQDFDGVAESYRQAAKSVAGLLCPAGAAWRAAWQREPNLKLYAPDGLHPTVAGSFLAALVIYQQLYGQPAGALPPELKLRSGAKLALPTELSKLLQAAAAEANQKFAQP